MGRTLGQCPQPQLQIPPAVETTTTPRTAMRRPHRNPNPNACRRPHAHANEGQTVTAAPAATPSLASASSGANASAPISTSEPPAAAGFDPARLDALITSGDWIATAAGPLPVPQAATDPLAFLSSTTEATPIEWIEQERAVLAGVLVGLEDQSSRWGHFRRRIGLRYDEPVPPRLWSTPELRLVAAEVDAVFRGEREMRILNAEAIRQDVRSRLAGGRYRGSLQQLETALADLLAWAQLASPLDFPIACDLFQAAKARQILYGTIRYLLAREHLDVPIGGELEFCRRSLNEALALVTGQHRQNLGAPRLADDLHELLLLATTPLEERPKPISTGIPSLDVDMRGGVIPGRGENLWVLAARSGVGKTTVAVAAAMGLATNGAGVLFLSCELGDEAIRSRFLAHTCRRNLGMPTPLFTTNDLEGRGRLIEGDDLELLNRLLEPFRQGRRPDGKPMGKLLYQSRFSATLEEISAVVEDTKAAHPDLTAVVLDHFHAMGSSPGYGVHTTAELAHRAMGLKALAGRCELDILVVAQLNRGAYASAAPDVSHLAGTSELERFASAVWLIDRPRTPEGAPPVPGLLEVHHGKVRHGQMGEHDLGRTLIRMDRAHCFLEADEARRAFVGRDLYPGVEVL
ncbi:MAG: DnaB-like helicase C-terminal domain-containing protein [Cyanobacteriota bacterium]|nr:DnaB-like helicase C-terminal domain-containing protein [Cyanobacteriota bacterium]